MTSRNYFERTTALAGLAILMLVCSACEKKTAAPAGETGAPAVAGKGPESGEPAKSSSLAVSGELPAAAAQPVEMPDAVESEEAGLAAYVRLREPAKLVDRAGAWVSLANPGLTNEAIRQQLQMMGIDLSQLKPGKNVSYFTFKPADPASNPVWAAIIPVGSESQLAKSIGMLAAGSSQGKAGDDLLLAQDESTLQKAQPAAAQLAKINDHPLSTDLQAYANVASLMQQYGPMLRAQATMLQSFLGAAAASATSQGGASAEQMQQAQKLLGVEVQALFDALNQIRSGTVNLDLDPNAAELSFVASPKPGTTLAAFCDAKPAQAPDLVQFLSPGGLMTMQVSLSDPQKIADIYMNYAKQILPADKPDQAQALQSFVDKLKGIGPFTTAYAFSMGVDGKPGMQFDVVTRSDNPDKWIDLLIENMKAMEGLMNVSGGGISYTSSVKQNARQVQGCPVDQIVMKLTYSNDMPPEQRKMIEQMMGGDEMVHEMMTLGKLMLMSNGHPIDSLAQRVAAGSGGTKMAAMQTFSPGAVGYLDMDILGLMNMGMAQARAAMGQGGDTPALPKVAAPPVSMAAYQQGGKGYYRLKLPRDLVTAVRDAAVTAAMSSGGGMPGMMPEGASETTEPAQVEPAQTEPAQQE